MTERAAALGVDLLWKTAVTGISREEVRLGEHTFRTRWIVGADGANSRVRRWANLDAHSRTGLRYAFRRHYRIQPWTDRMEIYWGKSSQAYTTGVSQEEVCVAVASQNPELRLEQSLLAFPELNARLRGTETASTERGSVSANRKLKRVWRRQCCVNRRCFWNRRCNHWRRAGSCLQPGRVPGRVSRIRQTRRLRSRAPSPVPTPFADGAIDAQA